MIQPLPIPNLPKPNRFGGEREYRCGACEDSGMQMLISGWYDVAHDIGRVNRCQATPERPIYRKCRGSFETVCPYRKHMEEQARVRSGPSRARYEDEPRSIRP